MNFRKILLSISIISFLPLSLSAETFSNNRGKVRIHSIKDALKSGRVDPSTTCVDEYLKRSRSLALRTGLGILSGPFVTAGSAGAGIGIAASMASASGVVTPTVLAIGGVAGTLVGTPLIAGSLAFQIASAVQLGQNNYLLRVIAQSYDGNGRRFNKFLKRFKRKYKKNFRNKISRLKKRNFANLIVRADREGIFCNGNLTGKYNSPKKRLAKKKHIYNYLIKNI